MVLDSKYSKYVVPHIQYSPHQCDTKKTLTCLSRYRAADPHDGVRSPNHWMHVQGGSAPMQILSCHQNYLALLHAHLLVSRFPIITQYQYCCDTAVTLLTA